MAVVFAGMALSGCNRIHEDLQPCPRGIRLKLYYDYNMKFADALPAEVKNVSVYVFDPASGRMVDQLNVPVGSVREHEFEVNLDHLPMGTYDFLVWCYGESAEHFDVKPDKTHEDLKKHHSCLMSEDVDNPGHQSKDIGRLYHGTLLNADCTEDEKIVTYEIPLVKNTNTVRLVLQHLSGEYLDPEKFDISLESDNGHMDHDNSLIAGHNRVYHPWAVESGTTGLGRLDAKTRAITSASALVAEHTIGRIIPETGVKLRVRNTDTGEEIINIPFVDYALLVKGNYNRPMSDQEYLDRQDEYNMVFFLDDNLRWMNQYIYINSWRIVLQSNEL
ncbi:MAG: FimB/Mfa2 family fimbrial subunit [Muribaculaceae bacterium]|nr:FimB/Mfa2 family fimbrial subunit [Muribaculaceae bacterium]